MTGNLNNGNNPILVFRNLDLNNNNITNVQNIKISGNLSGNLNNGNMINVYSNLDLGCN